MGVRSSALVITVICAGVLTYIVAAYPPVCGWGKDFWGDVGTWIGGVGSIAAAISALWIASESNRRDEARNRRYAYSIATAICNEIVGNCFDLEYGLEALDTSKHPLYGIDSKFRHLRDGLKNPRTSTFMLFQSQVHCFDVQVASAINVAYGGLIVCRSIEDSSKIMFDDLLSEGNAAKTSEWQMRYINERSEACKTLLDRTERAIKLIWPLTEYASFSAPVTRLDQRAAFEETRKAHGMH